MDEIICLSILISSGSVPIENILGYVQNRSKYVTKGRGYDFQEAIKECDSYITNPQVSDAMN